MSKLDEDFQWIAMRDAFSSAKYQESIDAGRELLSRHPRSGEVLRLLGLACGASGHLADAVEYLLQAIAALPGDALAFCQLGRILEAQGQLSAALEAYRAAVALNHSESEFYIHLADALLVQGRRMDALEQFLLAFDRAPANRDLAARCRSLVEEIGGQTLLLDFCRLNVARIPADGEAWAVLGGLLLLKGASGEAIDSLRRAVEVTPECSLAWSNLSVALQQTGRLDEALYAGQRAVALSESWAAPYNNLALALKDKNRYGEAEELLRRALELDPEYAEAWSNLGLALQMQGRVNEAETCFRRAFSLRPDYFRARSNLLFLLNYSSGYSKSFRLTEARQFGAALTITDGRYLAWKCDPTARRLRVGMVSGDFRSHPVGYFLDGFLRYVQEDGIELIAYTTSEQADVVTERLRSAVSAWESLCHLDDEAAANLIHSQGVHILIDLSGHTEGNRLPVFARKPAPVQVTWLGYFATTGLGEIDYILADRTGVPETERDAFVEEVCYLPDTRLCFSVPDDAPDVAVVPASRNGYLTLGSFQNLSKMGQEVFSLWSEILHDLPDARLRIQCTQLDDRTLRDSVLERFRAFGIPAERVDLRGATSRLLYLAAYGEVDFILDTFPYPGGTTTCEALWMGVPTLTLEGDSMLSRQGASIMKAAGLGEWVAADTMDYRCKARKIAENLQVLGDLRKELRDRLISTPLFDGRVFAKHFNVVLHGLWDKYRINS